MAYKHTREGVVRLLVLDASQVSGGLVGRKLRTKSVRVLETPNHKPASSLFDSHFYYIEGEVLSVSGFSVNHAIECAPGIHFFMTRKEAEEYE